MSLIYGIKLDEPPVADVNDGSDDAASPLHAGFSLKRRSPLLSADLQRSFPGLFANAVARPPR
ncbi:MAG: hypothetical protein U9N61_13160 [Euryarchaeota archaeon]|nr:hypothetical protein [Euryarchaeota archaeon]